MCIRDSIYISQKVELYKCCFLDKGEPPRTGTATVRLYTLNKTDEPPKFSQQVNFISHVACDTHIILQSKKLMVNPN